MTAPRRRLAGAPVLAVVALAGTAGLLAWSFVRPEATLRHGFEAALAKMPRARDAVAQGSQLDRRNLWLSRSEEAPLGLAGPVHPGDRIEISGHDGRRRVLEVTDVRAVDGLVQVDHEAPPLLMVSCREAGSSNGPIVRFVVEAERPEPMTQKVATQRTL